MPYIGRPLQAGVRRRYIYAATAGQTSFSGNDSSGISLAYDDNLFLDVYQNGVLLKPVTDYAATTGTSVVLTTGASTDDVLEMLVFDTFGVADTVSAKDGGAFAGGVTFGGGASFGDNISLSFGNGGDLSINHDGSNSFITDGGTGGLFLQGPSGVFIRSADGGENLAGFTDDGAATLYYDNAATLTTASTGVVITGGGSFSSTVNTTNVFGYSDNDTGIAFGSNGADIMQFYTGNNERFRITAAGALQSSSRQVALITHSTGVTFADDATLDVAAGTAGGGLLAIYNANSGRHALFGVGYGATYLIGQSHANVFAASDSDGYVCVFNSGGNHTFTIKNRQGSSTSFVISMFMAGSTYA